MRTAAALALLAALAAAEDDLTTHFPAGAPVAVRVGSLDRLDTVAKEWIPLLEDFGAVDVALVLEQVALSAVLFHESGLDAAALRRDRPFYVALPPTLNELFVVGPAVPRSPNEERALKGDYVQVRRGPAVLAARKATLAAPPRGKPTRFLDGDLAVHVYVGELAAGHKDAIEGAFALAAMQGTATLPESLRPLALPLVSAAKQALFSVESLDYALTWRAGRMHAEGLLRTKPDSPLRGLFARAGAPRDNPLVGYLPADAFVAFDCSAAAGWPGTELAGLIDSALGEGTGTGLVQVFNLAAPVADKLTGRFAGAMSIIGVGGGMIGIAELKEGVDAATLFKDYEVAAPNRALTALGAPVSLRLDRAATTHGKTEIHRVEIVTPAPELQFVLGQVQVYVAAEGRHFFAVMAPTALRDLRDLIDQVRAKQTVAHPHGRAMKRLGGPRSFGFTLNVAALRQLGMMLGVVNPQAAEAASRIPEDFLFSTAVYLERGDLRWKGDWPVREMAALAAALRGEKD